MMGNSFVFREYICVAAIIVIAISCAVVSAAGVPEKQEISNSVFDVCDFGAAGDGLTLDTRAIQSAIDACARAGGGTKEDAMKEIPELPEKYPEYRMFGTLPAYGFFCRHVQNLKFQHVELGFHKSDLRPALVCEDVKDLVLFDFDAGASEETDALIRLK